MSDGQSLGAGPVHSIRFHHSGEPQFPAPQGHTQQQP